MLPNLKTIIRNNLPMLYSYQQILDIFPQNTASATYKRNKNLRYILSPSLLPRTTKQTECSIEEYNSKCKFCKNFLVVPPDFPCFATKQKYNIKVNLFLKNWDSLHAWLKNHYKAWNHKKKKHKKIKAYIKSL